MRFLVRVQALDLPREKLLESVRAVSKTLGAEARNPKWTSYGALELDVFCPTRVDFDLLVEAVRPIAKFEFVKDLNVSPPHKEDGDLFKEARELFNAERYWECHEVLEGIWRRKQGEEKRLLQGIILVCAALVHQQKGEGEVAIGILGRAVKQLDYPTPEYGGFDIVRLRRKARRLLMNGRLSDFRV